MSNVKYANLHNGFTVSWGVEKIGFGQFYAYHADQTSNIIFSTEGMDRDFVKQVLCAIVDNAVFDDFQDQVTETVKLTVEQADALLDFNDPHLSPDSVVRSNTYREAYFNLPDTGDGKTQVLEIQFSMVNDDFDEYTRWIENKTVGVNMFEANLHTTLVVDKRTK